MYLLVGTFDCHELGPHFLSGTYRIVPVLPGVGEEQFPGKVHSQGQGSTGGLLGVMGQGWDLAPDALVPGAAHSNPLTVRVPP